MEFGSKITGKEPQLQRHYLDMFYGLKQDFDISKSRRDLGFNPRPSKMALIDALDYLKNWGEKLAPWAIQDDNSFEEKKSQ